MPFVNPLIKKRQRSLSRGPRSPPSMYKHPRLAEVFYDGAGSRKSVESSSTGISGKSSVLTRGVRRGISSMMSFFGAVTKAEKDVIVESDDSSNTIHRTCAQAGFIHANDSHATTIVKKGSRLLLVGASLDEEPQPEKSATASMAPSRHTAPNSAMASRKPSRLDLHRSMSTPALHAKLHHRLQQTFGNHPTVVIRSGVRSRPSVQTLQTESPDWMPPQLSSSPSTYNSGSGSSPKGADKSTPATSDGLPGTPTSVRHYEGITLMDHDQSLIFNHDAMGPILSTIPEATNVASLSIKTVEATAAAKIFFETHFNTVMKKAEPRQLRRERLEAELQKRDASSALQYEVFQAWYKHESNNLRRIRVLSSPTLGAKGPSSVAVGGFEIVKVLGKGSFGVVRLVKQRCTSGRKSSFGLVNLQSRANLRATAKDIINPHRKKRDISKFKKDVYAMKVIRKSDMLRNGQEGHLRAERDFLVAAEGSKWIISLLAAFQDSKFLYLVMDFCIGGDFLGLLIRKNILSEDVTRCYIAEMVLCIEEAHRMKWIHRDVKPDNFLIGSDGHLKISDFGLAFDGEWDHDQKFYQKHRSDLVDRLGLAVRGDDQDVEEHNEMVTSQKVAEMFPIPGCRSQKKHVGSDEALDGEHVLDFRNRAQRRLLARSVVGTSQYMAPEVIRGDMYDGRCD